MNMVKRHGHFFVGVLPTNAGIQTYVKESVGNRQKASWMLVLTNVASTPSIAFAVTRFIGCGWEVFMLKVKV